jgi:hypothetical protein
MQALWGCARRVSVVQAQRQIHRALPAAFTIPLSASSRHLAGRDDLRLALDREIH